MIAYSASRKYTHTLGSLYTNICTSICICTCICGTYIHTVAFLRCVFTNINHLISYSYSRSSKDSLNGFPKERKEEKESVFTTLTTVIQFLYIIHIFSKCSCHNLNFSGAYTSQAPLGCYAAYFPKKYTDIQTYKILFLQNRMDMLFFVLELKKLLFDILFFCIQSFVTPTMKATVSSS